MQYLQQHDKTVKKYYDELHNLLLRCGLHESEKARIRRFLNGLNNDIYDILGDMQYNSLHDLFILACGIENDIKYERQQFTKIEYDVCVAEIEHHDTQHIESSFATNHEQDIEINDERDNMLIEDEHCTNYVYTGNDIGAKITQGEEIFDAPNMSTNHVSEEQSTVESCDNFLLPQDDCAALPCDKEELCDDACAISMPPHMNKYDFVAPEPITCAENKYFLPIASVQDELMLLSSLNTLGYIEFDILCNLNNLNGKLFVHADLPWISKHTYYIIGKYDIVKENIWFIVFISIQI